MPTKKNIDFYAPPIRTPALVLDILMGVMLVDELYQRRVSRSLPWALLDRCVSAARGGLGVPGMLMKRLKK